MTWYDRPVRMFQAHPVRYGLIAFFLALLLLSTLFVLATDLARILKGA